MRAPWGNAKLRRLPLLLVKQLICSFNQCSSMDLESDIAMASEIEGEPGHRGSTIAQLCNDLVGVGTQVSRSKQQALLLIVREITERPTSAVQLLLAIIPRVFHLAVFHLSRLRSEPSPWQRLNIHGL